MTPRPELGSTGGRILAPVVPLVIVVYMILLFPIETRPTVFGVSLPIFRIGLLLFAPFMLARLVTGRTRPIFADWMMILAVGWILISFGLLYGLGPGLVRGFGVVIDTGGAYILGRLAIDSPSALRRFLIMISPGLFYAGLMVAYESITHDIVLRPFFADMLGGAIRYEGGEAVGLLTLREEVRLGLVRGYGPFSHPILGGVILTCLLPLWLKGGLRSWPKWLGISSALLGFFSLSSAAIMGLLLSVILIGFDWGKRFFKGVTWPTVTLFLFGAYAVLEVLSNRSVGALIAGFTLNPGTAYYRLLIWEYGGEVVLNHPWIGIGYNDWPRPAWMVQSVDAHFLGLAMRNGLPLVVFMLLALFTGMIGAGLRASRTIGDDRQLLVALNFTLVVIVFGALTVALYGEANVFLMLIIGVVASFSAGLRIDQRGGFVIDPVLSDGSGTSVPPQWHATSRGQT